MNNSIYHDISMRTDGNIYIGVVGPVRSGKSTFISRFMQSVVIPNIESTYRRERAVDELPQGAAGKTIMTTEPKFVPEEAIAIHLDDNTYMNVRLIDCVGYIVPSSIGYIENEQPRMVMTPWFDTEIPFNMAAEVGTQKVINEHSTIGLVITTDGSISDIPREEYEEAEARVVEELSGINKPFAVVLNCKNPKSEESRTLAAELSEKYGKPVIPLNCLEIGEQDIKEILTEILLQFPVKEINIRIPRWLTVLDKEHWLKKEI
ncbi:MAG: stage IV sporulation protein A, partial [Oscillospiraceae bacterium]|nr:stage IV sporulation protein A [Oscillospiraceae bacterium]